MKITLIIFLLTCSIVADSEMEIIRKSLEALSDEIERLDGDDDETTAYFRKILDDMDKELKSELEELSDKQSELAIRLISFENEVKNDFGKVSIDLQEIRARQEEILTKQEQFEKTLVEIQSQQKQVHEDAQYQRNMMTKKEKDTNVRLSRAIRVNIIDGKLKVYLANRYKDSDLAKLAKTLWQKYKKYKDPALLEDSLLLSFYITKNKKYLYFLYDLENITPLGRESIQILKQYYK